MKLKSLKFMRILTMVTSILFLLISFLFDNLNIMLFTVLIIVIHNILFSLEDFKHRIVFFLFQITFFVFLVGKPLFIMFSGENWMDSFSNIVIKHNIISLIISLYSLFLGSFFYSKFFKKNVDLKVFDSKSIFIRTLRKVSVFLFYLTYIVAMIVLLEKVIFVQSTDFREYYISYRSNIPLILIKIGDICFTVFFIFLATLPSKKEAKLPILLYILYSLISLGYGQRNGLILNTLILIFYFIIRDEVAKEKIKWFTTKLKFMIITSLPFILVSAVLFDYIRRDISLVNINFISLFYEFFISQGGSNEILSYGYILSEQIPTQNFYYTFGAIYIYITQNILTTFVFDVETIAQNTVEMATLGNSFGHTLTYIMYPTTYLQGIGMGSSYVAELYYDFGYLGLLLGGIFLGFIMSLLIQLMFKKWWYFALGLIMVRAIIYIPRASFFDWFIDAVSILNITTLISIWIITKMIYDRKMFRGGNIGTNIIFNK